MTPAGAAPDASASWVYIGRVGAVHGLRGEVRVFSLSDVPERLQTLKTVWWIGPRGEDQRLQVTHCRAGGRFFIMQFDNIGDRTQAALLTGGHLALPREDRGRLPRGQYFIEDIIGLEVIDEQGEHLGRVAEVWQTGANDVYEIHGEREELMLPALRSVILKIDMDARRMIVKVPAGY